MNINPIINLISTVIELYQFILLIWIILGWLIILKIVPAYHPVVQKLNYALNRMIEPALRPIRKVLPDLGGIDLSPVVLILLLYFIKDVLRTYFYTYAF